MTALTVVDAPTDLRINEVTVGAYKIPTQFPQESDGTLVWDSTTIVVVHISAGDSEGVGFTYCDAACVPLIKNTLVPQIIDHDPLSINACWESMVRECRNIGYPGIAGYLFQGLSNIFCIWSNKCEPYIIEMIPQIVMSNSRITIHNLYESIQFIF